jgi:uncharacterized protein YqeY
MSALADQLLDDLKNAMRFSDSQRREVLRFLRSDIHNVEIERGHPLSDAEIVGVIRRQIKQRRDSIEQFARGGRQDLVERESREIAVLEGYLPPQLSYDEILGTARAVVEEVGATGPRDMGKVFPLLRERLGDNADGAMISAAAREALSARQEA